MHQRKPWFLKEPTGACKQQRLPEKAAREEAAPAAAASAAAVTAAATLFATDKTACKHRKTVKKSCEDPAHALTAGGST